MLKLDYPFLSATEREELLKAMLKDVTKTLKKNWLIRLL